MYRVELAESAQHDLLMIVEFIAQDSRDRANTFIAELRNRITQKLSIFPLSGPEIGQYRYSAFGNYVVVYRVEEAPKSVEIVLVTEGYRNWRGILADL